MCRRSLPIIFAALAAASFPIQAKGKHPKAAADQPQDQIRVIARIPATGANTTHLFSTQHYRRNYLYVEHESGKTITLVDVTQIDRPTVLADMSFPTGASGALVAVTGNAAVVTAGPAASNISLSPQTFRILSFADPLHPVVKQEIDGVTAMARDDKRGLIFLANSQGIWILQQEYAMDPEAVKEWEHMMLDNR